MSVAKTLWNTLSKPHRVKQWPQGYESRPWFDRPDAMETLEQRRRDGKYTDDQVGLLRHWIESGYLVLDGYVPMDWIDEMQNDVENLWTARAPISGLTIEQLRLKPTDPQGMSHADLLRLDEETRNRLRREQRWRIHGFHAHSTATKRVFLSDKVRDICSLIFDTQAKPEYTINFMYGSEQHVHQDTCVFHVHPMNYLIGAWLACEDVKAGCGPLVYYPGSHREPIFSGFDNYPQTNLKTCDKPTTATYNAYLENTAARYPREVFLARKGQLFLWHGMLIHGGDGIADPTLSRRSYVCHYIPKGMNKEKEIVGPFNW